MGSCGSCNTQSETSLKGCNNPETCGTDGCNKLTVFDWLADIDTLKKTCHHLVEIRFKNERKGFYKKPDSIDLHVGDIVVVESYPGYDVGIVSLTGSLVSIQLKRKKVQEDDIKNIYRIADQQDIDTWKKFRGEEFSSLLKARKISKKLNLIMKICDVEYQGDGSKATFYYTSDGRVDFRDLIKEFALMFRCKVDMRQIGYRQESAKVGGIGSCGRELCCSSWLTNFRSVNTMAARYQQLSINPQKLAGQCGKLKCCLNFELDSYLDAIQHFPSQNTIILTEKGKAICLKIDIFRKKMWFMYNENSVSWFEFDIREVKKFIELNKKGEILPTLEELKQNNQVRNEIDIIQKNSLNRFDFRKKKNRIIQQKNIVFNKRATTPTEIVSQTTEIKKIIKKKNILQRNQFESNRENKMILTTNIRKILSKKSKLKE